MALFKFSSRSSARHSGAQLRLAPNKPCMTLVIRLCLCVCVCNENSGFKQYVTVIPRWTVTHTHDQEVLHTL